MATVSASNPIDMRINYFYHSGTPRIISQTPLQFEFVLQDGSWGIANGSFRIIWYLSSISFYNTDNSIDHTVTGINKYGYSSNDLYNITIPDSMYDGDDAVNGSSFADYLMGYAGNDTLMGGNGGDTLVGGDGSDALSGGAGDDILRGDGGQNSADGGDGIDTYLVAGPRSAYSVSHGGGCITLTAVISQDALGGIERVQFTDGTLVVDPADPAFSVHRLYEAALDRAPDAPGLTAWTYANTTGMSMTEMARRFLAAPEFVQRFGIPDNAGFVDLLYRNLRDGPADEAGASGWLGALDSGRMTREEVLLQFADSAETIAKVNASVGDGIWLG